MIFIQMAVGKMQNFSYLFADPESREGFIVDPAFEADKILAEIKKQHLNISRIILTHHHSDHINATTAIKAHTGAEVICHRDTAPLLHGGASFDRLVDNNFSFSIGHQKAVILHTPGHAPGAICIIVADQWLVTADTLFIGDCGRADLPGSSPEKLFASLQQIRKLPDHLIVCPGHDYGTAPSGTLGEEKKSNPALRAASFADFMKLP